MILTNNYYFGIIFNVITVLRYCYTVKRILLSQAFCMRGAQTSIRNAFVIRKCK
nr:MAG TPA: hypothetical protein [Caudoviricetes sp.]